MNTPFSGLDRLCSWITSREALRQRKVSGGAAPWTDDQILQQYRFCNVHREDDRVTQWLAAQWRRPHADDPWMWHAMIVARMFNWPPSLEAIGYPVDWKPGHVMAQLTARRQRGEKIFSSAYIVSTNGVEQSKLEYVVEALTGYRQMTDPPQAGDTLAVAHAKLASLNGLAGFMAGQVVADLKYTPLLAGASDWWDWAVAGPGSKRGLNRVCARALDTTWPRGTFLSTLSHLREEASIRWSDDFPRLCLQDLQNCLCEFDKYERVRLGEGRPRAYYKPERAY
jgi:hypothetical protein